MGRVQRAWRKLQWSLGQRGLWGTLRVVVQRALRKGPPAAAAVHPFDEEHGTETGGLIGGGGLSDGHENDRYSVAYYGIAPSRFQGALERWRSTRGTKKVEDYTFVDVGSGKGRAMMLASAFRFCEVVGIELNAGLAEVAERNLARWKALRRPKCGMRMLRGDATTMELPDGPLLVFMYNPFHAPVMRLVLQRLDALAKERESPVDLIYVVPQQEAVFAEFPQFALLWSERIGMSEIDAAADQVSSPEDRCSLYRR